MRSLKDPRLSFMVVAATVLWLPAIAGGQTSEPKDNQTGSISGPVIVGGKGADGLAVAAFGGANSNLNRRIPAAQTTTDSEGYYRLAGLAAGNYQVTPTT